MLITFDTRNRKISLPLAHFSCASQYLLNVLAHKIFFTLSLESLRVLRRTAAAGKVSGANLGLRTARDSINGTLLWHDRAGLHQ